MISLSQHSIQPYCFESHGRAKHPFPSLVQLGENDVLRLVGAGLGREVDQDRLVDILGQLVQNELLRNGAKVHSKIEMEQKVHCREKQQLTAISLSSKITFMLSKLQSMWI